MYSVCLKWIEIVYTQNFAISYEHVLLYYIQWKDHRCIQQSECSRKFSMPATQILALAHERSLC